MKGKESKKRGFQKNSRLFEKDTQSILEANATFYSAFSTLDYTAMEDLWMPDNTSICVFPSCKPLKGFAAIMKSWKHAVESMDGNNLRNWMAPDDVRFEYLGTNKATIVCDEMVFVNSSRVVRGQVFQVTDVVNKFRARNMFKKLGNKWYLCYHEAFMLQANRHDDLGLSVSSSSTEDSRSTFLSVMTGRAERKRDRFRRRSPFNMFLRACDTLSCGG
jgi:ketosteroid isomerase-like protein